MLHQALVHVGRLLQLVQLLHEAVCDTTRQQHIVTSDTQRQQHIVTSVPR